MIREEQLSVFFLGRRLKNIFLFYKPTNKKEIDIFWIKIILGRYWASAKPYVWLQNWREMKKRVENIIHPQQRGEESDGWCWLHPPYDVWSKSLVDSYEDRELYIWLKELSNLHSLFDQGMLSVEQYFQRMRLRS